MKTNIFLCVTEYHILLSIMISSEIYMTEEYSNTIYLCNGGRFKDKNVYDTSPIGNIKFIRTEEKDFVSLHFVKDISLKCTNGLFFFNLNYPHFTYISYLLAKKSVPTSIVQDGLALYMTEHHSLREKLSYRWWSYQSLRRAGIKDSQFLLYCFGHQGHYGGIFQDYCVITESPLMSYIWLTAPDKAQYAKEKVKLIPFFSSVSLDRARSFFRFGNNYKSELQKNDFLFVDQRIEGTSVFLKELSERFPFSTIYVKLHPRSPLSWANDFKELPNVKMIDNMRGVPLELLIQILSGVIVISAFSSALLMENSNCRFYYLYPWFAERGYGMCDFDDNSIHNPVKHIGTIKSLEEIELF